MWNWFGGGAAQRRKDTPKNAILGLRSQLEMLQKRERHLMNQIDEQDGIARKHVNSNMNAAKAALKRKKAHQGSLDQTLAQITTLEQQINSIESANINRETLAAMQAAGAAMKDIHKNLTPDKVDEMMDTLREQNALSDDIVNAITSNTVDVGVDDDMLEEELEQMQQEEIDQQMTRTGNVPLSDAVHKMPSPANQEPVPNRKQAVEDDEEAELEKLRAEMAM